MDDRLRMDCAGNGQETVLESASKIHQFLTLRKALGNIC